ncbi:MAG: hypothetical protein N3B13_11090, partial [Deltaproteobacteria bacterium]|nr:hypothetical protein [Deltaproteobacteria bacterium]
MKKISLLLILLVFWFLCYCSHDTSELEKSKDTKYSDASFSDITGRDITETDIIKDVQDAEPEDKGLSDSEDIGSDLSDNAVADDSISDIVAADEGGDTAKDVLSEDIKDTYPGDTDIADTYNAVS